MTRGGTESSINSFVKTEPEERKKEIRTSNILDKIDEVRMASPRLKKRESKERAKSSDRNIQTQLAKEISDVKSHSQASEKASGAKNVSVTPQLLDQSYERRGPHSMRSKTADSINV